MGNQATSLTTGYDLSSSTSMNRRSRNFSNLEFQQPTSTPPNQQQNARNEQIQSTLINCFALGDDMIHYLWKFYDLDHNNELDWTEMRIFLTELIHTLHDVCLRSELLAVESIAGKSHQSSHSSISTTITNNGNTSDLYNTTNTNTNTFNTNTFNTNTNTSNTTNTNTSNNNDNNESKEILEKKKSRFGLFKKKNRMSSDLNEKKSTNGVSLWRRSRNLSRDEDTMKRRSVAIIPDGAGHINHKNFEQMISGNTERDEIKKRWKLIREHMESNIDDIIKSVDKDKNGTINYEEFLGFMKTYDIRDMLNNMDSSIVSPNLLLDGKIMGLFGDGLNDENASSEVSSPRSIIMMENAPLSPQTKEGKRRSAIFQVLSHTNETTANTLPSLELPSNKKHFTKSDLLNTVIFGNGQETLDFLAQYSSEIDTIEMNAALRRAIVDNNPSKTRALLKYGASVCHSFKDENQEENREGLDMLTCSLLKVLSSYSPCMDDGEIERFQLIIRLLISKGWLTEKHHSSLEEKKEEDEDKSSTLKFKQLSPDIIYEYIISHNDSMSMYEDELRDALGETKTFEEIELEYSNQLED